MIDWSANATPKRGRDSIWMAAGTPAHGVADPINPTTRAEALDLLTNELRNADGERVLVGLDFSFGYPAGVAQAKAEEIGEKEGGREGRVHTVGQ
jgi:precorrin-8X/cobalt-precorrin-8 methylmutase